MQMLKNQRGLSFTGVLFIIVFVGLIATIAVRLTPIFLDNMGIQRAVNGLMNTPDFGKLTKRDFYLRLAQKFYENDVRGYDPEKCVVLEKDKKTGAKQLAIRYNREAPFTRNVFFLVKFEQIIPITKTGVD